MPGVLTKKDVLATVLSAMVGAGIFLTPGLLLRQGAAPWQVLVFFAVAGVIALSGALCVAELASRFPGNGGPMRYLNETLGAGSAFLFQWSRFWVMQSAAVAVLARTCVRFLASTLGVASPFWETVAAMLVVVASAALNARGLRLGALVQVGLTALKVGALLALAVGALLLAGAAPDLTARHPADLSGGPGSWMLLAIFAFGGWAQVTFLAGELRKPSDLPRPMALGIVSVLGLYALALLGVFAALPAGPVGSVASADAAEALFGPVGRTVVAVAIAVAVLGGLHTFTMAGARLHAASAEAGLWWKPFARRNASGAPGRGLLLQAEWACALLALSLLAQDVFTALIGSISTGIWLWNAVLAVAWFKHRAATTDATTPYRTPGGPVVAGFFGLASVAVVVGGLAQDAAAVSEGAWASVSSLWALLGIASGLPVWLLLRRKRAREAEPFPFSPIPGSQA